MLGPNLTKAIIELLYDSGMINRDVSQNQAIHAAAKAIFNKFSQFEIQHAEAFLASLDQEEFQRFVVGDWNRCTLTDGESFASDILNEVFEES